MSRKMRVFIRKLMKFTSAVNTNSNYLDSGGRIKTGSSPLLI